MKYAEYSSYEIKKQIDITTPIILPVGAVEAHGPHLPLETDNILAEKYSEKIAEKTDGLVLPTLPYGQVWSLKNFPGSLTLSNETVSQIIFELGESIYHQGGRLFVIVSGHLGNMTALKEGARKLYDAYRDLKVLYIFYPAINKLANKIRESKEGHHTYIHACEIETSLLLYLDGERVRMDKAIDDPPILPITADFTPTPWEEFTNTAVLGEATLATEEKGRYIIENSLDICVRLIKESQKNIKDHN